MLNTSRSAFSPDALVFRRRAKHRITLVAHAPPSVAPMWVARRHDSPNLMPLLVQSVIAGMAQTTAVMLTIGVACRHSHAAMSPGTLSTTPRSAINLTI